ncbi:golgin subfamily A member 6-like protein 24 [Eleginops maclovinus]
MDAMDRRNPQNHRGPPRGNSRTIDLGAVADRAYSQIHCRNGQIYGLNEFRGAFQQERVSFSHRMRFEKEKNKRLEEVLRYKDSGLDQQRERQNEYIYNCEAEISRLKKNLEAAECQHKQQVDIILAKHVVEKELLSDQSNQGTSHSQNSNGPLQLDTETTKLLLKKGDELSECVSVWEQRYSALEETMKAAELKHKQQLDEKVAWYEAQQEKLSDQKNQATSDGQNADTETMKVLMRSGEELLQFVTVLKDKNSALKEKMEAAELKHQQQLDDTVAGFEAKQQELSAQSHEANLVTLNQLKEREEELLQCEDKFIMNMTGRHQMEMKLEQEEKNQRKQASANKTLEMEVQQMVDQLKRHEEKFSKDLADKNQKMEAAELKHQQQLDDVVAGFEAKQQKLSAQSHEANMKPDTFLKKKIFFQDLAEKNHMEIKLKHMERMKRFEARKNKTLETEVPEMADQLKTQEEKFSKDLSQNINLKEKMEAAELKHQQQLDDTVAGFEAKQQKLSAQNHEANLVTLNQLKKREEELLQCEQKLIRNLAEKPRVEMKLKEVTQEKNDLAKKNLDCETDVKQLKEQMREHEEKFSRDLAQNQETCETKVSLVETKLKEVTQEKDDLAQQHQNRQTELKEVQAELKTVKEEKKQSQETNQSLEKEGELKDSQVKQLENDLEEQKERFIKDLAEKHLDCELFVEQKERTVEQLRNQLEEQKEMFTRDLAQNQETWETKVNSVETKLKEVTQEKDDLAQQHQNLEKELKDVEEEKNQSCERGIKLMETKVQQFEEQMKEQQGMFYKDLAQKQQSWETKVHQMETRLRQVEEEKDDLALRRLSWETKEKKEEEEKKLLEDLCLHMKNKRRGFFSRRREPEDRDVTLQKMISKMKEKEMRKKASRGGAEAESSSEEKLEREDGGSAPAGSQ